MKTLLRSILARIRKVLFFGADYTCPICESRLASFIPMGQRLSARCPVCGSLERHRLIWLYCTMATDLFDGRPKSLLHVAPEPCLAERLRKLDGLDYVSADLASRYAAVRMDVTDIQFAEDSFDVIFCNHVLEHVPDDAKAMSELLRVLKPGGWAIMQVPVSGETTQEDLTITSAEERLRLYGQHDHVRQYGRDYATRLRAAGFQVKVDEYAAQLPNEERLRYGVRPDEELYLCHKPRVQAISGTPWRRSSLILCGTQSNTLKNSVRLQVRSACK